MWLIISADVGADGPTKDDLFAGSKEGITLGSENIALEFTLEMMTLDGNLPWFSRVENPAGKKLASPQVLKETKLFRFSLPASLAIIICRPAASLRLFLLR